MARDVLGHIDCPTCGHPKGMRITHDKNGEPFGFSEACCNQQLRVGGEKRRVAAFVARYPWAAKPAEAAPVAAAPAPTEAPAAVKPAPAPKQAAKPAPAPAPAPAPKRASVGPFDFLMSNK